MSAKTSRKQKIKVKEYMTDKAGHKIAAVIDIKELSRLEGLLKTSMISGSWRTE